MWLNRGDPIQPETSQEEPASRRPRNSSVPSYRPTQKWGSTRKGRLVISRLGRGAEPGKHLFGIGIWVGAQAGVESIARDQGEAPKCTGGVEAPGETRCTENQAEPCKVPVRRWAHRPGSVKRLEIGSGQRLSPFVR